MQRKKSWKWKGIRIDFHCLRSWFLTKPISFITSWSRFSRYAWKKYKREWKKENPQLVAQNEQICCVTSCEFDEKQATKPKFVSQSRPALYFSQQISSICNKCFCCATNWLCIVKNGKHRPKLATKQCCATSWGFLYLVLRRLNKSEPKNFITCRGSSCLAS